MDLFEILRGFLVAGTPRAPLQMNQPDLDPVDPITGKLLPGGAVPPSPAATVVPTIPNGGTTGALNAQEALAHGDPKLIEFMRQRRAGGAVAAPVAAPPIGFGAKPRQTSFSDGT